MVDTTMITRRVSRRVRCHTPCNMARTSRYNPRFQPWFQPRFSHYISYIFGKYALKFSHPTLEATLKFGVTPPALVFYGLLVVLSLHVSSLVSSSGYFLFFFFISRLRFEARMRSEVGLNEPLQPLKRVSSQLG